MRLLERYFDKVIPDFARAETVAFDIQNVWDWVKVEHPNGWGSNTTGKVLAIAPPYQYMWMEFRQGSICGVEPLRYGIAIGSEFIEDESYFDSWANSLRKNKIPSSVIGDWGQLEQPHWVMAFNVFTGADKGHEWLTKIGTIIIRSDEEGRSIQINGANKHFMPASWVEDEDIESFFMDATIRVNCVLTAMTLMHIKNIVKDPVIVPPKLRKAREKRGIPTIEFKTLKIEPLRKQVQKQYEENQNGPKPLELAFHLVRGHFKDFREKGLFGRESLKGVYWWDAQARGDKANGQIIKDYEIKVTQ
jgi:hypothetical protein